MAQRVACVLLLVLGAAAHAHATRSLQQQNKKAPARQTVTPAVCKNKIPSCQAGKCTAQGANVICSQCRATYVRTNGGQHCVCPVGTYERCTSGSCSCVQCEQGFFCTGGVRTARNGAKPMQRGARRSCFGLEADSKSTTADLAAKGVTTAGPGAKQASECLPMAGYIMPMTWTQPAKCAAGTWSAGGTRDASCTPCPAGLWEDETVFSSANALRTSQESVCMVPPGAYLSDGEVYSCDQGTFRASYVKVSSPAASKCFSCPKGVTTKEEGGATSMAACNVALPGFNINQDTIASQGVDGLGSAEPDPCPKGTFFEGGAVPADGASTCQPCPLGTTTLSTGTSSVANCGVPPGYFLDATAGKLVKCPTNIAGQGYYRNGWARWDNTAVQDTDGTKACTACGAGILSAWTEADSSGSDNTSLVATSADACYIEAGWGMEKVPGTEDPEQFRAAICPNGTYSAQDKRSFGLWNQPCMACFPNQITLRLGAINYTECTNAAGWGVFSADGSVAACPRGTWNPAGSGTACTACPAGRTTDINPEDMDTAQDGQEDCVVAPGYGIPDDVQLTGTASDATLPPALCPIGTYSNGGEIGTRCTACSASFTTSKNGTQGADNSACNKCIPGYGRTDSKAAVSCSMCSYGFYQTGYNGWDALNHAGDGEICLACPLTKYAYVSSKGQKELYDSEGITFSQGSTTIDACTPRLSQQAVHAGQVWGLPDSVFTATQSIAAEACVAGCRTKSDNGVSCFAEYDYATGKCRSGTMQLAAEGAPARLLVKLIPSGIVSGTISAVGAVGQGSEMGSFMGSGFIGAVSGSKSGLYRQLDISSFSAADQSKMGVPLADDQGVVASMPAPDAAAVEACRSWCDKNPGCWAVTVISGTCTLRTGAPLLDVRSFYVNPKPGSVPAGV
uniref:Tyrosine-protein kinase ephrin type A/B receptor-like domain-containing protein n=1 Tax=Tetradesmus obliquus TaxID=3088 RepID=A0A383VZJ7_TETOB|eukprot:jgi/Sobl393_1/4966/SZX70867.1